ncbi:MAG: YcxB family protein [Firmicutes bacterium]|nr:YcxB family protein [Bacillota bacterium]
MSNIEEEKTVSAETAEPAAEPAAEETISEQPAVEPAETAEQPTAEPVAKTAEPKALTPVEVELKVDAPTVTAFLRRRMLQRIWIPLAVLAGICIFIGGMLCGMIDELAIGLTLIGAGVIISPATLGFSLLMVQFRAAKLPEVTSNKTVRLTYGENISGVEKADGTADKKVSYTWDSIIKAAETKQYFYLYVNSAAALIAPKNGFIQGTPEDLRTLIAQKLPDKTSQ